MSKYIFKFNDILFQKIYTEVFEGQKWNIITNFGFVGAKIEFLVQQISTTMVSTSNGEFDSYFY